MKSITTKLVDSRNRIVAKAPITFNYVEPLTKVSLLRKASTLFISEERLTKLNEWVYIKADTNSPPDEKLVEFIGIQSLISTCIINAEDINNRFLQMNLSLETIPKLSEIEIRKFDFMKLKDRIMDFVKSDKAIKGIEKFSSNQKFKPFRRSLDAFITDRNVYTHGQLHFLRPNFDLVIEFIQKNETSNSFAYISIEDIQEYNLFYGEILDFIDAFEKTR